MSLLSTSQVASLFGVNRRTVINWVKNGARGKRLEGVMVGGRVRISSDALHKFTASPSPSPEDIYLSSEQLKKEMGF